MPDFTVVVDASSAIEALARKIANIRDLRPAWKKAESVVIDAVRRNFLAGGRPSWPPIKDRKTGRRPLIGTGELFAAATGPMVSSRRTEVVFVPRVGAAGIVHQFGFSGNVFVSEHFRDGGGMRKSSMVGAHMKRMEIPPRPYFVIPHGSSDISRIEQSVLEHVMKD